MGPSLPLQLYQQQREPRNDDGSSLHVAYELARKSKVNHNGPTKTDQNELDRGNFFAGYSKLWGKASVPATRLAGKFDEIRRDGRYSLGVDVYRELLDQSESQTQQKTSVERCMSFSQSARSDSRVSSGNQSEKSKKKKNRKKGSSKADSAADTMSLSENRFASSSRASSNKSESKTPDFAGGVPSTKAHMIPNRQQSKGGGAPQTCYKYYNVICQSILGFSTKDSQRLEKIAFEMADCSLNFLRAPVNHGLYLDKNPCWILLPACSFDSIKEWTPGTPYPVLAVANGFDHLTTDEAYQFLCSKAYNDEGFNEKPASTFKRSKCTKDQLVDATKNLEKMVLAMAETLVGRTGEVAPYQYLLNGKRGRFEERPADQNQWKKEHYDSHLFEETIHSITTKGVQVPTLEESQDLEHVQLLVCHFNPDLVDVCPDPMLLLMKAAINWSWYCDQKLLPACGEEEEDEEMVPTTPVPEYIEFGPVNQDQDELTIQSICQEPRGLAARVRVMQLASAITGSQW